MAPNARRSTVVALVVTLFAGVLALAAPGAPAGALTVVQSGVKPSDPDCQSGRLHGGSTIGTCGAITVTGQLKVNGTDVAAGTPLGVGDVVTVSVVVTPQGGHSAMYAETIDGIRNNQYDTDAVIPIGLPTQTGTLLSSPTAMTMSRTDDGDRGNGPAINCLAQGGQDAARTDPATAVTLGAGPVGLNGMTAAVSGGALTARWTTMAVDRCVNVVSNNGFYPGQSISFTQTVLAQGATAQTPTWSLGGLTLQLDDGSRTLTWGSAQSRGLPLPAAPPTAPGAPTSVTAVRGNGQATVSWTAPASNGSSAVTGYRVTPRIGGVAQTATTFATTATTQTVTGLTNGTAYTFTVAATNAIGTGPESAASAAVTPVAPWAPFTSADDFTRQQHLDLAGREPTAAELTAWREALEDDTQTAPELVESLRTAPYWDGTLGPVVRLYEAIYLRHPDTAGLQYWEGEVRSGRKSINQMASFVAQNAEFRALYGTLGDVAFITKVYELVLERPPSPADLTYWSGELQRGQGRGRMVLLFSGSAEYKAKAADRVAAVLIRYGMLRQVGPTSAADAAVAVIAGGSEEDLVAAILASPEYATRAL